MKFGYIDIFNLLVLILVDVEHFFMSFNALETLRAVRFELQEKEIDVFTDVGLKINVWLNQRIVTLLDNIKLPYLFSGIRVILL